MADSKEAFKEGKKMFKIVKKEIELAGKTLSLETGRLARQADGAVLVTYGETQVLCTAVFAKKTKPDMDFFPLTVNYQEKFYSVGRIPGSFARREGRPSEKETLVSRLIDRPIRPLFPSAFKNEVQVIATVVSYDLKNDPDMVALIGCSAALALSGAPFLGPIGAARVGYVDGQYVLNPEVEALEKSALDLVVAGTNEGVLMVESEAKELPEDIMLGAVDFGYEAFQPVIEMIGQLKKEAGNPLWEMEEESPQKEQARQKLEAALKDKVVESYKILDKQERVQALSVLSEEAQDLFKEAFVEEGSEIKPLMISGLFKALQSSVVRTKVLEEKERIDGRAPDVIRPIVAEVGVLKRTHGSALFTRGETQALGVATLGTKRDAQLVDALEGLGNASFMLHYNFPAYSVGEIGRMMGPGRREIGHGKLAWRAIHPMLPSMEDFPYVLRLVSEVTESNGSSSMATVCASSLALMDAGVPLERSVAGIAMGLIKEGNDFVVLSDIMGDEDHLGDMDFKVAGTQEGITSLQMDIKITSITSEIMHQALVQAKEGRMHILGKMAEALHETREDLSPYAPRLVSIQINKDKIREVIGTGGKVIREIIDTTGATVDVSDEGVVTIGATDLDALQKAKGWIEGIVQEPEVGKIYQGTVVKITEFGAFVNIFGNCEGLCHISEITGERLENVEDVWHEGKKVFVKLLEMDGRGRLRLSARVVDQRTGQQRDDVEEPPSRAAEKRPSRSRSGGRSGDSSPRR